MPRNRDHRDHGGRRFPTTKWTELHALQGLSPSERRAALGDFVVRYRPALEAFIRVTFRDFPQFDAEEALQGFTADKLIDDDLISRVSKDRGRLRSLLMKACSNYCYSTLRSHRHKPASLPTDYEQASVEARMSFEQGWADVVVSEASRRVQRRFAERDQPTYWALLKARIIDPAFGVAPPTDYEQLGAELGMTNRELRNVLSRAKHALMRSVREVVGEYVESNREIDDELAELIRLLDRRVDDGGSPQ